MKNLKTRRLYRSAIFMQDGATPHTALSTRAFLNSNFRNRTIGKHFDWPWPPRLPDLTTADFYPWPVIKRNMYTSSAFKTISSLKRSITNHHRALSRLSRDSIIREVDMKWNRLWYDQMGNTFWYFYCVNLMIFLCKVVNSVLFNSQKTQLLSSIWYMKVEGGSIESREIYKGL